jgi:hypothetical protein
MGVLDDEFATWTKDGKFDTTVQPTYDLIMYKEVEVLTVDEWIGKNSSTEHEYKTWVKVGMNMLAAAIKRGEVE